MYILFFRFMENHISHIRHMATRARGGSLAVSPGGSTGGSQGGSPGMSSDQGARAGRKDGSPGRIAGDPPWNTHTQAHIKSDPVDTPSPIALRDSDMPRGNPWIQNCSCVAVGRDQYVCMMTPNRQV